MLGGPSRVAQVNVAHNLMSGRVNTARRSICGKQGQVVMAADGRICGIQ